MLPTIIVILLLIIIVAYIWLNPIVTKFRRSRRKKRSFPSSWLTIINNNVPVYNHLPETLQTRLKGHIQVFLAEKQFIGCGGLSITEEIKVTIAAQACLLLLNERGEYYPLLKSILVYPTAYQSKSTKPINDFLVEEKQEIRLGESWENGQLVLAWQQIQYDSNHWQDGHNVILHEFAHQLDQEEGYTNGVPMLRQKSDYKHWARIFSKEYEQLCSQVKLGLKTIISPYGATHPAEFFAVVTETFFEHPQQLNKEHKELYELLHNYYQINPLNWN